MSAAIVAELYDLDGGGSVAAGIAAQFPEKRRQVRAKKLPTPLPPFHRACRVTTGPNAETLGYTVAGEWLLPDAIVSVGDIKVEEITATHEHLTAPAHILDGLLSVQQRHPKLEPITDPELVAVLEADLVARAKELHAIAYAGDDARLAGRDIDQLELLVREFLRSGSQGHGLGSVRALAALQAGFRVRNAPVQRIGQPAPTCLDRLPLGVLAGIVELPEEVLYAGETRARFAAKLAAERKAAERTKEAATRAKAEAEALQTVTPREANLLVVRRVVGSAAESARKVLSWTNGPPVTTIHEGFEYATYSRSAIPTGATVPNGIVELANVMSPALSELWMIVPDDDRVALTTAAIEGGRRRLPPRHVAVGVIEAMAKAITTRAPVTSFIDLKSDKTKCRARVKILREHLERIAFAMGATSTVTGRVPLHKSGARSLQGDPRPAGAAKMAGLQEKYTAAYSHESAPFTLVLALQLGVVRLQLSPLLVAAEIASFAQAGAWPGVPHIPELVARLQRLAATPTEHALEKLENK